MPGDEYMADIFGSVEEETFVSRIVRVGQMSATETMQLRRSMEAIRTMDV